MDKRQYKRKALAQNFFRDAGLIRQLIKNARIRHDDTVYEIGPGKGIITAELARAARNVIAIEKDRELAVGLRARFRNHANVEIIGGDFLEYRIQANADYKIFANIPFNATTRIVRKILYSSPAPSEAFLVTQKQAACRLAGWPHETLGSIEAKPWWEFAVVHRFQRTDFFPVPDVDAVLLRVRKRVHPLLRSEERRSYRDFVACGFGGWNPKLRSPYKRVFTYTQWKRLARDLGFPINATPTQLTFEQWIELYRRYRILRLGKKPGVTTSYRARSK